MNTTNYQLENSASCVVPDKLFTLSVLLLFLLQNGHSYSTGFHRVVKTKLNALKALGRYFENMLKTSKNLFLETLSYKAEPVNQEKERNHYFISIIH